MFVNIVFKHFSQYYYQCALFINFVSKHYLHTLFTNFFYKLFQLPHHRFFKIKTSINNFSTFATNLDLFNNIFQHVSNFSNLATFLNFFNISECSKLHFWLLQHLFFFLWFLQHFFKNILVCATFLTYLLFSILSCSCYCWHS